MLQVRTKQKPPKIASKNKYIVLNKSIRLHVVIISKFAPKHLCLVVSTFCYY